MVLSWIIFVLPMTIAQDIGIEYFHTSVFQEKREPGMYLVDIGIEDDILVAAYGYFNQDKYCDIVTTNTAQNQIMVYIYSVEDLEFQKAISLKREFTDTIINVIPGDYNNDGTTDLLVALYQGFIIILYQIDGSWQDTHALHTAPGHQPAVFDINGDSRLDLVMNSESRNGGGIVPLVYRAEGDHYIKQDFAEFGHEACLPASRIRAFSIPYTFAFVDLNDDWLADIFLTVGKNSPEEIQIWLNTDEEKYCLKATYPAPDGMGQVTFADLNKDGVTDLIFPINQSGFVSSHGNLHVVWNPHKWNGAVCERRNVLEEEFDFSDISQMSRKGNKYIISLKDKFYIHDNINFPINIAVGDLNHSGYPELLVNVAKRATDNRSARVVIVSFIDGEYQEMEDDSLAELYELRNVISAHFFDLDEDGSLDILVSTQNTENEHEKAKLYAFYNNWNMDAFYLKAQILHGKQEVPHAITGASFKFEVVDPEHEILKFGGCQHMQNSYRAMETPYMIFGLGRVTSYVENFYVTVATNPSSTKMWTPVMPNSYLIVQKEQESGWDLELFTNMTNNILYTTIVCGALVFILCILILWGKYRERKEDYEGQDVRPFNLFL